MTNPDELERAVERLEADMTACGKSWLVVVHKADLRLILAANRKMREALEGLLQMADVLTGDHVAEGVHTGLRKGSNAADADALWKAIRASKTSAWSDACAFFADSMTNDFCGFGKQIKAARSALSTKEQPDV